jgi:hypothetical protein
MTGAWSVRLAAAGLGLLALAFGLGAFRLGFRHEGVPGPGVLPLAASLLLLPIALRLLLRPALLPAAAPLRASPLAALGLLAVYGLVLPRGGFVLPTVALVVTWVLAFHGRGPAGAAALAALLTAAAAFLFARLLGVPLPLWPGRG